MSFGVDAQPCVPNSNQSPFISPSLAGVFTMWMSGSDPCVRPRATGCRDRADADRAKPACQHSRSVKASSEMALPWKPSWVLALGFAPMVALATPEVITELAKVLPAASSAEVAALAREHLQAPSPDPRFESVWWHLTFYRWCETDAAAAREFVGADHDGDGNLLKWFVRAAVALDPVAARGQVEPLGEAAMAIYADASATLDEHRGAPDGKGSDAPMGDAGATPVRADGGSVRTLVETAIASDENRSRRLTALRKALGEVAAADPAGTLAAVRSIGGGPAERRLVMEAFASLLRDAEPAVVAGLLDQIPAGKMQTNLATSTANKWAQENPGSALAWADGLPDGPLRDAALVAATSGLAEENPLAIFDLLERNRWRMDYQNSGTNDDTAAPGRRSNREHAYGLQDSMNSVLSTAVAQLAAEGRAAEAMARLAKIPDPLLRRDLVDETIEAWLKQDMAAAVQWLAGAPDGLAGDDTVVAEHLTALATSGDLRTVIGVIDSIGNLETMRDAVRGVAEEATKDNAGIVVASLVDWAATLPPDRRLHAEWSIFYGLSKSDPMTSAELLTRFDFGDREARAWGIAAAALADRDPVAAAAFLQEKGDALPAVAFSTFTERWVRRDSQATSRWIAGLAPGARRDAAIVAMVADLTTGKATDFEAAIAWADEIVDPVRRRHSTDGVLAARRAAEQSDTPKP